MSFIAHCVMALLLEPSSNVPSSSGKMNSEFHNTRSIHETGSQTGSQFEGFAGSS